jgi:endonuclease G
MAGPVFGEKPARLQKRVAVPEAFFMIVVDESEGRVRAMAFLLPQDAGEGATLDSFVTTIDEIEMRTGLDFLSALPDEAENALEAKRVGRVW